MIDCDTSICENYDEAGVPVNKLSKITMNIPKLNHYDYYHNPDFEGASAQNTKRKHFTDQIDHIDNSNRLITSKMKTYFNKTYSRGSVMRDTRLTQASKEMERQHVKLQRLNRSK